MDIVDDGGPRPVAGTRRRAVLAVLALHPGEVVGTDLVVEAVWGGAAPSTAVNTVQRHVSALRQIIGARGAVVARPGGYLLETDTDVADAEAAILAGSRSADATEHKRRLEEALALWRGPALFDTGGTAWLDTQAARLEGLRLRAGRDLVEARLTLGEHSRLVPELENLAHRFPFDERVHGQLMLALYRSGRQADALAVFRRLDGALAAELGIDPGQPLRDLNTAILRQDAALDPPPIACRALPAPARTPLPVPAQLPPALPAFTGRATDLDRLGELLTDGSVAVISGTAGVGKTTLAVHWAHGAADRFPDGQLYVDLRGFGSDDDVVAPVDAACGFLAAWAVGPERIPRNVHEQTALYRSLLAGRRVLVVLDNARDAEQVRPLLPGAPGCVVVVTSRRRLEPLLAADGAHLLTLDPLGPDDARALLARRVGAARVAAEPEAVADIVARCAGLPLALAVVAARAVARPAVRLADHAGELRAASRLDALQGGDVRTDVRTVLSWSHDRLTHDAARLFRCIGLHPGPTVTVTAAASLVAEPVPVARALLGELLDGNVLDEPAAGRFAPHDLLHAFARERVTAVDRPAVVRRMIDHYLRTAYAAAVVLDPHRDGPALPPPAPGVVTVDVSDHAVALSWLTAERPTLLAVLHLAERDGLDAAVWQLAWALADVLERQGRWADAASALSAGVAAAERAGERREQARMHRILARTLVRLNLPTRARWHLDRAIALAPDPVAEGHAQLTIARIHAQQGRDAEALRHAGRALILLLACHHVPGTTVALNAVGRFAMGTGDFPTALAHCRRALVLARRTGDRTALTSIWDSLGSAYLGLGRRRSAARCFRRAVTLCAELGYRPEEATARTNLADVYRPHRPDAAAAELRAARAILDELQHRDADTPRRRLYSAP